MNETTSIDDTERSKFVRACLVHVPFDGWSQRSLELAAEDCGLKKSDVLFICEKIKTFFK